jgi:hypothetical protein
MGAPIVDVAGIRVALEGLDEWLHVAVCSRYLRFLSDRPADFVLEVQSAHAPYRQPEGVPDVQRVAPRRFEITYGSTRAALDLEAGRGRATVLSSVYLIDSLLRMTVGLIALERDALLVHSSGVRVGEEVLVCFGPSGVGKTTVARSVVREAVLCDEMMLVSLREGVVWAGGTPFHGDLTWCQPGEAPILALVQLVQAQVSALAPLSPAKGARALLGSTLFFCKDEELADRLLGLALRISTAKMYSLAFKRETHVPTFVSEHLRPDATSAGEQAARP